MKMATSLISERYCNLSEFVFAFLEPLNVFANPLTFSHAQMYVTAPDTDTYAIPKVIGEMPKKVRLSL